MPRYFGDPNQVHLPPPTSFQRAIQYTSSAPIHEAYARAIVIGTDVYYSPNSSKAPPLPPQSSRYIRNPLKDGVEEFHNPQWWKTDTGYLPFLPTSPQFGCPPFDQLYNRPLETGTRLKRRVRMDSNDVLNWSRLETTLTHIFKSFQSMYCIPDMSPIVRTSLACQDVFEYPSQFQSAEKRCRNWFAMWMAMVSLGIAVAQIYDGDAEDTLVPKWYTQFVHHTDEVVLAGVRQQLGQFNPWFPRAGVFIDLCSPQEQPTVDFFVRLGIPVWYPWGTAQELRARQNPSYWAKYVPPAHMLQRAHSFLSATPDAPPSAAQGFDVDDRPWLVFFANRARRATGPMPIKKPTMKVFHWKKDDNGQWQRTAVLKQLRSEILDDYGKNQKVFDERTNEWDCCSDMGELDAEERQALWDETDECVLSTSQDLPPLAPDASNISPQQLSVSAPTPVTFNHANSVSSAVHFCPSDKLPTDTCLETDHRRALLKESTAYMPDLHSPAETLRLFFGFIAPPPSVRLALPKPSEQQIKELALGVGCPNPALIQSYVETPYGRYAPNFFWSMSQSPLIPPSNALFDLARGNTQNIQQRRRIKFLRQLPGDVYLFDFEKEATVEWHICVTDVSLALFIVRLDDELSDYDVAQTLLNQGSPFWTVLPSLPFPVVPSPLGISRLRLSTYQFTAEDYHGYCHDRAEVLTSPRVARQALMRGGILWRLAMEHASFQDVLAGPSIVATIHHQCKPFNKGSDGIYIDDVLTIHEMEVICGVYYVYTGKISINMFFVNTLTLLCRPGQTNSEKILVASARSLGFAKPPAILAGTLGAVV